MAALACCNTLVFASILSSGYNNHIDRRREDKTIDETDKDEYPSVHRIEDARKMSPKEAASLLDASFSKLMRYESGSFLDVRNL